MAQQKEDEKSIQELMKELSTSERGLTGSDAQKRLKIYGKNEITEKKRVNALLILISQFKSILIVLLIFAALFSAFIENFIDSAVILAIVFLNAVVGFRQEYKAENALAALKKLAAPHALVVRDGKHRQVDTSELVPGDVVLLEEGSRVPADMRLLSVVNLKVNEASLTGESEDVEKKAEDSSFSGTVVTYGRATGVVYATGMSTEFGKIAGMLQEEHDEQTPLQKNLGSFGKRIGILVAAISIAIIAAGLLRGGEFLGMIKFGIALAVAAVPEGLPAIVTITMAFGMQRMSQKNAIVRRLTAVEALGSTTFICADKTGTMTKNEMTVTRIYAGDLFETTGHGFSKEGSFLLSGKEIEPKAYSQLMLSLKIAALCNNAYIENSSMIGDSTELALLVAASKASSLDQYHEKRLGEVPFSSERKMMSTLNEYGIRRRLYVKGAVEIVLKKCAKILKNGKVVAISTADKKQVMKENERMASDALRVLCMAYRDVEGKESPKADETLEKNLVFAGLIGMIDPPREGVSEDVKLCEEAGIGVIMITGDHANTAGAIARQIGIPSESVVTGNELEGMSDAKLESVVERTRVYARVDPIQKVRIVDALKKKGHVIAMTGDGVNDAPALKRADVGIAMGIKGTDVAKEASDMVLTDDNFSTIVSAVKEGRTIYSNIQNFIEYLLSSNIGEVILVAATILILGPEFLPITAVQLLWINLVTDGLPATALGLDPAPPEIMKRKPKNPQERPLSRSMLRNVFIIGTLIAAATFVLFYANVGDIAKAQTVAFTSLVVFEMVRVYSVRLKSDLSFSSNKKLLAAVFASLFLQMLVLYTEPLQIAFSTVPLSLIDWGMIIVSAAVLFAFTRVLGKKMK
ncbi:MAG: calcium-translocating P-type ATPase, PMCA-type [Candidatus Aenigmarchaeota archaeon]|nr:calcium-translocating P-type ATPase, PMCA-type [Candidatus Aenigmarchaeota archaeon]